MVLDGGHQSHLPRWRLCRRRGHTGPFRRPGYLERRKSWRYFIADAAKGGHDFAKLVEPFKDLHITVVVHNVGGSDLNPERIDERRIEEFITNVVNKNEFLSLLLTGTLLPQLRRPMQSGHVPVLFVGSVACDLSPARLPIYAASKGVLQSLTRGLNNDNDGARRRGCSSRTSPSAGCTPRATMCRYGQA
ncbi:hypothetical protein LXA43DRAFT_291341 [Ganoderma leucocontextum]|nr:hypothetical protein LXA43DRAFT_291341 [Ganoderma leucocontextum]